MKNRGDRWLGALGRLRDGVSFAAGAGRFDTCRRRARAAVPRHQPPARRADRSDSRTRCLARRRGSIVTLFTAVLLFLARLVRQRGQSAAGSNDGAPSRARRACGARRAAMACAAAIAGRIVRARRCCRRRWARWLPRGVPPPRLRCRSRRSAASARRAHRRSACAGVYAPSSRARRGARRDPAGRRVTRARSGVWRSVRVAAHLQEVSAACGVPPRSNCSSSAKWRSP